MIKFTLSQTPEMKECIAFGGGRRGVQRNPPRSRHEGACEEERCGRYWVSVTVVDIKVVRGGAGEARLREGKMFDSGRRVLLATCVSQAEDLLVVGEDSIRCCWFRTQALLPVVWTLAAGTYHWQEATCCPGY